MSWSLDSQLFGAPNQLHPGRNAKLDIGVGEMGLDGPITDEEPAPDRDRRLASNRHSHDLALAPGKGLDPYAERRSTVPSAATGQEDLHLVENRYGIAYPGHMVDARQLDQLGARDVLGEVPRIEPTRSRRRSLDQRSYPPRSGLCTLARTRDKHPIDFMPARGLPSGEH